MEHKGNTSAYVLAAVDAKTGFLYGYYNGEVAFPTVGSIWYAKFAISLKTAKNWKELVETTNNHIHDGDKLVKLIWKIQKVSMSAPEDVE